MRPSQERLMQLVRYDADTGIFTRIVSRGRFQVGCIAGTKKDNGYLHFSVDYEKHGAHRLAWLYVTGEWPEADIDHINGVRDDNRFVNLRSVSRSVNLQNRHSAHNKTTGLLGSYPAGNGFMSRIAVFGKDIYLGYFKTAEAAHAAYMDAKRRLHEGCTI